MDAVHRTLIVVLLGILGLLAHAGLTGFAVWLTAAWPDISERRRKTIEGKPVQCLFLGFVNIAVGLFVTLLLMNTKVLGLLGILLLIPLFALVISGYATAFCSIGARIAHDGAKPHIQAVFGGAVVTAASLVPIVGTIFSLGLMCKGAGGVVMSLLSRPRTEPPPDPPNE